MLLPLPAPTHCLACQTELFPGQERPERFCSNKCLAFYYAPPGTQFPLVDEPTPLEIYLLNMREKAARVGGDLQAVMAMRKLTGTPLSEDDLAGLRWLAAGDPVAQAVAKNQPLPPEISWAIAQGLPLPAWPKQD